MSEAPPAPRLRFEIGSTVVPGDRLGPSMSVYMPGSGTYLRQGQLYASLSGRLHTGEYVSSENDNMSTESGRKILLVVQSLDPAPLQQRQVLQVGQAVLAKVLRTAFQQQQTIVRIHATEFGTLQYPQEGVIRREDIWSKEQQQQGEATSADTVAFCVGDVILARILSIGDTRRYILTTAESGLGVVHAVSASSGKAMLPLSLNEMKCPETGLREKRKCAKPGRKQQQDLQVDAEDVIMMG